ncbi:7015_t:CDS:2 [Scutellospora calospora]|uniref:7015_t:CDS:1 n=1 Tax=Scutellospora calospora TaxID=85575 RepID=A0ACA9KMJ5_9GLOM|nr:7015_t:CDS:2 [Scutellospora calospora]
MNQTIQTNQTNNGPLATSQVQSSSQNINSTQPGPGITSQVSNQLTNPNRTLANSSFLPQQTMNLNQTNGFGSAAQLQLVPAGRAYGQQAYEPVHKCYPCGHVHSCQDCNRVLLFRQALGPQETKYFEPVILSNSKSVARKYRRMEIEPYFRRNVPKNVGISQDEILERTLANPSLSIIDIVNQIAVENDEARERALLAGDSMYHSMRKNKYQDGANIYDEGPSILAQQGNNNILPSALNEIAAQPSQNLFVNQTSEVATTSSSAQQSTAQELTAGSQTSATTQSTTSGAHFTRIDPSLGFKKATIKYALPKKPDTGNKPRPNPVTPNLKINGGGVFSEMSIFFKKLWGWY